MPQIENVERRRIPTGAHHSIKPDIAVTSYHLTLEHDASVEFVFGTDDSLKVTRQQNGTLVAECSIPDGEKGGVRKDAIKINTGCFATNIPGTNRGIVFEGTK